jgi:hypothetical protein
MARSFPERKFPVPSSRQQTGRLGGLTKWSRTTDRTEGTAAARAAGPGCNEYWLTKLDPERFADATQQQRLDAADAMRRAHFARLAMKSAQARRTAS